MYTPLQPSRGIFIDPSNPPVRRFGKSKRKTPIDGNPPKELKKILEKVGKLVQRTTISIISVAFYDEFNSFTILGDGFPTARFVLSKDEKNLLFSFITNEQRELMHMANPYSIPYIFPIEKLEEYLQRIQV